MAGALWLRACGQGTRVRGPVGSGGAVAAKVGGFGRGSKGTVHTGRLTWTGVAVAVG